MVFQYSNEYNCITEANKTKVLPWLTKQNKFNKNTLQYSQVCKQNKTKTDINKKVKK